MANFKLEIRDLRSVIPGSEDEPGLKATVPLLLQNLNRLREKCQIFSPHYFLARGLAFENKTYRQGFGELTPRVRGAVHHVLLNPMVSRSHSSGAIFCNSSRARALSQSARSSC